MDKSYRQQVIEFCIENKNKEFHTMLYNNSVKGILIGYSNSIPNDPCPIPLLRLSKESEGWEMIDEYKKSTKFLNKRFKFDNYKYVFRHMESLIDNKVQKL